MKDLYTFDTSLEAAQSTYDEVNTIYRKLLDSLDLTWVQAKGSTGTIGGHLSHEFHILSEVGEDSIIHCASCQQSFNSDLLETSEDKVAVTGTGTTAVSRGDTKCVHCGSSSSLSSSTSIEVGHTFLLGTKYTQPLQTVFVNENSEKVPMEMGCYGLGVSRLLAAAVEVKSSQDELRWPLKLAPYVISVIPPKHGSKEEPFGSKIAEKLYNTLRTHLPNDVIYDDRTNQTIGKRLQDNKKLGIPFVVVCGKDLKDPSGPLLELHDVNAGAISVTNVDQIVKQLYDVKNGRIKLKL